MEWETWLLLVIALPFVLYSLAKSGLRRVKKSTQNEAIVQ
jgi:hypothetical protein